MTAWNGKWGRWKMADKALNYIGIMRKAGACATGETDSGAACRGGKAKLLLLAADASENARHRAEGFVYGRGIPLVTLPYEKADLAGILGRGATSMLAVTDLGLADAVVKALTAEHSGYETVSADLGEKLKKERERKTEQQRHTQNKRFGKRRKKA